MEAVGGSAESRRVEVGGVGGGPPFERSDPRGIRPVEGVAGVGGAATLLGETFSLGATELTQ